MYVPRRFYDRQGQPLPLEPKSTDVCEDYLSANRIELICRCDDLLIY